MRSSKEDVVLSSDRQYSKLTVSIAAWTLHARWAFSLRQIDFTTAELQHAKWLWRYHVQCQSINGDDEHCVPSGVCRPLTLVLAYFRNNTTKANENNERKKFLCPSPGGYDSHKISRDLCVGCCSCALGNWIINKAHISGATINSICSGRELKCNLKWCSSSGWTSKDVWLNWNPVARLQSDTFQIAETFSTSLATVAVAIDSARLKDFFFPRVGRRRRNSMFFDFQEARGSKINKNRNDSEVIRRSSGEIIYENK